MAARIVFTRPGRFLIETDSPACKKFLLTATFLLQTNFTGSKKNHRRKASATPQGDTQMAFHDVERGTFQGNAPLVNTVQLRVSKSTPHTAAITISQDVFKKVGEPMFFNVMIGSGEHSGFIALIPRNSKGPASYKAFTTSPTGKACVVSISTKKLGLVTKPIVTCKLPFEITSDGIIADIRPARQASVSKPLLEAAE